MATILDVKPIDRVTTRDAKSEMLMFFGIMRNKKEYEMLKSMKELADAKYKIKSFKRQLKEIDKNIEKLKDGKPIPIPIPPATEVAKAIPIPPATEEAKTMELHSYYTDIAKSTSSVIAKPGLFINKVSNYIPDRQVYNFDWKCEKCNEKFRSRKLLKVHISERHSY